MVAGAGGREHALAWALARSSQVAEVLLAPGNPGSEQLGTSIPLPGILGSPIWNDALVAAAVAHAVDLVVIGPEAPLASGVVDALAAAGILAYGPLAAAARLEASKAFAKGFMQRHRIPTAEARSLRDVAGAQAAVRAFAARDGGRVVVKESGLAAGKGVTVATSEAEGVAAVAAAFAAGVDEVVIERYLEGDEVSLLLICDGERAVPLLQAEDHKTIFEGDRGPMTGGMGVVAPATRLTPAALEEVMARIVAPTLAGMRAEGHPFRGTLFLGLMVSAEGPQLLEYNVRFGDPETQALLPLLADDLYLLLRDASRGELHERPLNWRPGASACVVMAAEGYPGTPTTGVPIGVPADLGSDVMVFHAGTVRGADGLLRSGGGRVLAVTAVADGVARACADAYAAVARIDFPGAQVRRDIGARQGRW
jgi:phosphoribosylamine--glycine ligase